MQAITADILLTNAHVVNEGAVFKAHIAIEGGLIKKIISADDNLQDIQAKEVLNLDGLHIFPGVIDDQVHFREPGLTHKGELYTEAKAAVAGGVTSYMEMPNTVPGAVTNVLLEQKYSRASEVSLANYSFYMGTTNSNIDEVTSIDPRKVCGIKIFMGSSTGDMLVDNPEALDNIFKHGKTLIATHCEVDPEIKKSLTHFRHIYGDDVPAWYHPYIRSREACYGSSTYAFELAQKHNARLHILHISTAEETMLFSNDKPLAEKRITAEACIHHLWFSEADYKTKGNYIKWNPAVKSAYDRDAIFAAVLDNRIDVIATDHAPHTIEEKNKPYIDAPSGGPLIQHTLNAMLDFYHAGKISLERIAEKMSHNPAILFEVEKRGFIREGYFADLAVVNLNAPWTVDKSNLLYKCGWSPFEGHTFKAAVQHTFVNGNHVYNKGTFNEDSRGMRLTFNR
ncbi:MAG: dihydroorotase [Sphingobacteriales bacterium JAD_PAG50586_3]|nr:MAG: dihydroorotase [Sphingobacteriales bacterium JAD_PAG50586_3]